MNTMDVIHCTWIHIQTNAIKATWYRWIICRNVGHLWKLQQCVSRPASLVAHTWASAPAQQLIRTIHWNLMITMRLYGGRIIKNKSIYDHLWISYNYSTNYLILIRIISEPWTVTSLSLPPLPLAMRGDGFRGALKRYDLTMDVTKRNRPTESTWLHTTQWDVVWCCMYFFLAWLDRDSSEVGWHFIFQTCFEDIVDGFPK